MMNQPPFTFPEQPSGSHYINVKAARQAVDFATPLIEAGMVDPNVIGSGFLVIVILDPGLRPGEVDFEAAILHEQDFGDRARWDADYAAFARAKARSSWLSGMDSSSLQRLAPHLLCDGDTLLAGGVWLDGIVVGVSGAFPLYDEVYANTIATYLRALAREARQAEIERPILQPMRPELIRT